MKTPALLQKFAQACRRVPSVIFGNLSWRPPDWSRRVGEAWARLESRYPRALAPAIVALILLLCGVAWTWQWYQSLPKPRYVSVRVGAIPVTKLEEKLSFPQLNLLFQRIGGPPGGFEEAVAERRPTRTGNQRRLALGQRRHARLSANRRLAGRSKVPDRFRQKILPAAYQDGTIGLRGAHAALRDRNQGSSVLSGPDGPGAAPDHGDARTDALSRSGCVGRTCSTRNHWRFADFSGVRSGAAFQAELRPAPPAGVSAQLVDHAAGSRRFRQAGPDQRCAHTTGRRSKPQRYGSKGPCSIGRHDVSHRFDQGNDRAQPGGGSPADSHSDYDRRHRHTRPGQGP